MVTDQGSDQKGYHIPDTVVHSGTVLVHRLVGYTRGDCTPLPCNHTLNPRRICVHGFVLQNIFALVAVGMDSCMACKGGDEQE